MNIYDLHHKWIEWKKKRSENKQEQEDSSETVETTNSEKEATDSTAPSPSEETGTTEKVAETANSAPSKHSDDDEVIDLRDIMSMMWKKKWWYIVILPCVAVLSAMYILNEPQYYETSTTMAPEEDNALSGGGALSSIASSFGIDLSQAQSSDAISPTIYPELMDDNGFVTNLFNIRVKTADGAVDTTYYSYLRYHRKHSWFDKQQKGVMKFFEKLLPKKENVFKGNTSKEFNPYYLSKEDDDLVKGIRKDITIDVDKKTGVISIVTEAEDPLVCQTLADSVRNRLQEFIIQYRTSKARRDVDYYKKLSDEARATYEKTRRKYAEVADENLDVVLETEKSKIEDLENTMQMQYNTYTAMNTQLEAARAKLRMYTPVFTMVQGAAVPIKPAGPKRMLFVLGMMILAFGIITICAIKGAFIRTEGKGK